MSKMLKICFLFFLFTSSIFANTVTGTLVKYENFQSAYAKPRNVHVWLPKDYDKTNQKYAVLYMHDGQNLFDKEIAYAGEWQVDEHLQRLMDNDDIRNTIVIGIWNTDLRFREYQPQSYFSGLSEELQSSLSKEYGGAPNSDNYLKFIVKELKPFIDKNYRTLSDKKNTFMAGSSMGGLISIYALAEYPDVFSGVAAISTHWPVSLVNNDKVVSSGIIKDLEKKLSPENNSRIYFDFGTETLDARYEPHQQKMDKVLKTLGFIPKNWITRKFEGHAHHEPSWRARLSIPFKFLLAKEKKESFTVNAMAPLKIDDSVSAWNEFREQLKIAKNIGVNAISVDVWWGLVEGKVNNHFDWSYYDKIFEEIIAQELQLVPIMSFHRCGGYEGDICNFPIPDWVWTHYESQGITKSGLMYKGENNQFNDEFVSLWKDQIIIPQYVEFMQAFQKRYSKYANSIDEINISLGPSGELRYPSYNPEDVACSYPTRGCFQAYSEPAIRSFQKFVLEKYSDLGGVIKNWPSRAEIKQVNQIQPPSSTTKNKKMAEQFIDDNLHFNTQYGRDFIEWYHQSLIDHGNRMVRASFMVFDSDFSGIPIGIKLAGIHWQMSPQAPSPRATEMAVGTIWSSERINSRDTGYGYSRLMAMIKKLNQQRKVWLHFTNLEGDDADIVNGLSVFSMARTLVNNVATAAFDMDVPLKGENAMASGVETEHGWDNIENSFRQNHFGGLTILRLENITKHKIGRNRLKLFISKYLRKD